MSQREEISVEWIQDMVEEQLMKFQFYKEAKNYILYRSKRSENRLLLKQFCEELLDEELMHIFQQIQKDLPAGSISIIYVKTEIYILFET